MSTSAEKYQQRTALVLTCYRLTKGRATFYRPETIVASLLLLMVLSFKEILKHTSKRLFVVQHFRVCVECFVTQTVQ